MSDRPWDLYVEGKGGGSRVESLGREIPDGWGLFREPPRMAEDEEQVWMGQPVSFTSADAALIAAAPGLLEALEGVNLFLCYITEENTEARNDVALLVHAGDKVRGAIAKARAASLTNESNQQREHR